MTFKIWAGVGLACLGAAASSMAPADHAEGPAAKKLADALSGRVAGQPQRCIRNFRTVDMQVIDDGTILFRKGATIYLQHPAGGCPGLSSGSRTLVTREVATNQLCEGDINRTVDLMSRTEGGSCVFGPFVPYTRPH